jgi:hypothetical protein
MENLVELTNFIVSLSEDPDRARRFREDPSAVIQDAGLTEETSQLLLSPPSEFMEEVFARRRPPRPRPITHVQTIVQTHVSTNTNTQVTTNILVVIL